MYSYCQGIRLNKSFQEKICEYREYCPYYRNIKLSVALMYQDQYVELETYNTEQECKYFDKSWQQNKPQTCETSDMPMDGILTLWNDAL